jgi:hypothetical protein
MGSVVHLAHVRRAQEAERWREVGYELLMRIKYNNVEGSGANVGQQRISN